MCRPVDGSREAACPGGHIGPPLHNAGNVPEITESGVENEHFPNGAGRSPPPTGGAEQSGLRRGAPGVWLPPAKFRNGIWGVSHGHPALRVRHRWCTARADVGIGPYGKERTPHQPPGLAAQSGASAARMGGMGRERGRDHPPKGPSTPDNPSVTAKPCQLPLHKGAFGDGGCGLPRRFAPRNDSPDPLSFRRGPTGRRGNPSFLRWTGVRAAEVVGPYAPRGTGERHAGVVVPYGWSQGGLINCRGSA